MEVGAEVGAEVLTEINSVVVLALILIVVAAIRKGSIHSLTGAFLLPYNN